MAPYYSDTDEFRLYIANFKNKHQVPLTCPHCQQSFTTTKANIVRKLAPSDTRKNIFCSSQCQINRRFTQITTKCDYCQASIFKYPNQLKRSKLHFCNSSCAAKYNNSHKKHGTRRSKLESYLEQQMRTMWPNLKITTNGKEAIGSELDFYFPQLRLAIELNGIFHYEPIYGQDKLDRIVENDRQKSIRCTENGIEFCVINASSCTHLNQKAKDTYWKIVQDIITPILGRIVVAPQRFEL